MSNGLTTKVEGGVIHLAGDLTAASEVELSTAFDTAKVSPVVVLDFSGLAYMNSSGIGLLVTTLVRAQRVGVRLVACGLDEHYREIFALTRLDEPIPVFENAYEALKAS